MFSASLKLRHIFTLKHAVCLKQFTFSIPALSLKGSVVLGRKGAGIAEKSRRLSQNRNSKLGKRITYVAFSWVKCFIFLLILSQA